MTLKQYKKEQEKQKKKEQREKRKKLTYITLICVLSVAILALVLYIIFANAPDLSDPVTVALEIRDYGTITLELYPNVAPKSVENFLSYVKSGFYEGVKFHRVLAGFMIQAGDKDGDGISDPSLPNIYGEFALNGYDNKLSFERGVIGLARSQSYNSASSQFFICHEDSPHLDGAYAAFGKVVDGIGIVDRIANCDKSTAIDSNGERYQPLNDIIIEKAYVVE